MTRQHAGQMGPIPRLWVYYLTEEEDLIFPCQIIVLIFDQRGLNKIKLGPA